MKDRELTTEELMEVSGGVAGKPGDPGGKPTYPTKGPKARDARDVMKRVYDAGDFEVPEPDVTK